jgi:hypothetical protein
MSSTQIELFRRAVTISTDREHEQPIMLLSNRKYPVFIFPYEGGWAIGLDVGHYSVPLPKQEALLKAFQCAREKRIEEVAVLNQSGELLDIVKLPASEKTPNARDAT